MQGASYPYKEDFVISHLEKPLFFTDANIYCLCLDYLTPLELLKTIRQLNQFSAKTVRMLSEIRIKSWRNAGVSILSNRGDCPEKTVWEIYRRFTESRLAPISEELTKHCIKKMPKIIRQTKNSDLVRFVNFVTKNRAFQSTAVPKLGHLSGFEQAAAMRIWMRTRPAQKVIQKIKFLTLGVLGLVTIPKEIAFFSSLKYLALIDSKIESLPSEIVLLKNLRKLNVCNSMVKYIPKNLDKMEHLRFFRFRNTRIQLESKTVTMKVKWNQSVQSKYGKRKTRKEWLYPPIPSMYSIGQKVKGSNRKTQRY